MAKRIDVSELPTIVGTLYPPPYDEPCRNRERKRLGDVAGLTQFGVNLLTLKPGSASSQRHWHSHEDEFVYVLSGEVVMVSNDGEVILRAGDAAGFKAGTGDGHCLQNRSDKDATVIEIGSRIEEDAVDYPDIDMILPAGSGKAGDYRHRDGTPYPKAPRRGPSA